MTKLVKTDHTVDAASNFAARLTQMLGARSTENVPAIVRPKPTGPKLLLTLGEHVGTLYEVSVGKSRRGRDVITFSMEIDASTSMPALGLVDHSVILDTNAGVLDARFTLESVGLLDEFLASEGKAIECNKRVRVKCDEKLMRNGLKFLSVRVKAIDA